MTFFDTTPAAAADLAASGTPLQQAVSRLVDLAASATGAPIAYVWVPDEAAAAVCATARPGPRLRWHAREVVQTRRPVVVHDGYAAAGAVAPERTLAFLGAPLLRDTGGALGALCLVDRRPRMWTTEEVATVVTLARAIAAEFELDG